MTKNTLYLLLRACITASLSKREEFIDKVSKVIERYVFRDPETAREISSRIADALERINTALLMQLLFNPPKEPKADDTLNRLSSAIEKLNGLLEEASLRPEIPKPQET